MNLRSARTFREFLRLFPFLPSIASRPRFNAFEGRKPFSCRHNISFVALYHYPHAEHSFEQPPAGAENIREMVLSLRSRACINSIKDTVDGHMGDLGEYLGCISELMRLVDCNWCDSVVLCRLRDIRLYLCMGPCHAPAILVCRQFLWSVHRFHQARWREINQVLAHCSR
jgi:hypothetical protein